MKALGLLITVIALFALGFAWRDVQNGRLPDGRAFERLVGLRVPLKASPVQEFKQAYNRILASYYKPVKPTELKYAGLGGMMASLGDPHTMFLVPQVAKQFDLDTKANYGGVGARLSAYVLAGKLMGARAVTVFEDGPAFAAGLRRGDIIVGVDGTAISGIEIDDIVSKIMGKEGTLVKLSVLKDGKGAPVVIPIRRARVITPTVDSTYFAKSQVGYLLISSFSAPTAAQFDKELAKLERNPMKGLVIDVRNNPGGYLDTAVDLLSHWKENATVVTMKLRDGGINHEYTMPGELHHFKYPVVVLINGDSASAAEIFSGALRDYKMATLVGTHSYGKASVQEVYYFKDGSSGKVTIARYFLPSGDDIGRKVDADGTYLSGGLEPDVKIAFQDVLPAELQAGAASRDSELPDPATDNQLRKAIEVVLSKSG